MDTGAYVEPSREPLAAFLTRWLRDYAKTNVSPRTYEGYEHIIVRHLIPALGAVQLTKLAPAQIQRYYSSKLASGRLNGKGGLSPRTVRHHHVTLHDALQSAVKWGLLARNPADAVDAPKFERAEMNTLDDDGVRTFLAAAKGTQWYPMVYLALFTGLRRSEVLALRWGDVDLDLARIYVNRAVHRLRDGSIVFRTTKSVRSRRLVALPPSAALMLRDHRECEQKRRELVDGATLDDQQLVFARIDGSPIPPDSLSQAWSKLAKRTGFQDVRLHDARHTHATLLLKQDVHPKIVQERLGHSTIATTLDIYSHVVPGLQDAAARAFDVLFEGVPAKVP
jgi:integrase